MKSVEPSFLRPCDYHIVTKAKALVVSDDRDNTIGVLGHDARAGNEYEVLELEFLLTVFRS